LTDAPPFAPSAREVIQPQDIPKDTRKPGAALNSK